MSAQVSTHVSVKSLRGDAGPALRPIADEPAPFFHISEDFPLICLIVGGREIELQSRADENELLAVTLRNLGRPHAEFYEMGGLDHGSVTKAGMIVTRESVRRALEHS